MKVANGVEMLELHVEAFGNRATLNPTLIWDGETAVLIDTGMPRNVEAIRAAMNRAGVAFEQLQAIIITHQDLDHIGSLPEILQELGNVKVYAHQLEKPYIEGELPLIKTDPNRMDKAQFESLPKEAQVLYSNPPKARVDETLLDGEELPYCGGIQVIFTPGHTAGHISLYIKESKTLVVGDALIQVDGKLYGPVRQTTLDMDTALQSLEKFLDLDIETIVCYHGGLCKEHCHEQIKRMVKENVRS